MFFFLSAGDKLKEVPQHLCVVDEFSVHKNLNVNKVNKKCLDGKDLDEASKLCQAAPDPVIILIKLNFD